MTTMLRSLTVTTSALLLAAAFSTADAKPTQAEVTRAQADCHAHKSRVLKLESRGAADADRLERERTEWESACAHAEDLANARDGVAMPKPVKSSEFSEFSSTPAPREPLYTPDGNN